MAITSVAGTITRTFFDGKGAEVTESWQAQGETRTKRWAAFFEQPHGLSEGDVVEVSGMHGDKIDEWNKDGETRRAVKRTLNKARIKGGDAPQQPVSAPAASEWATTAPANPGPSNGFDGFDSPTPF